MMTGGVSYTQSPTSAAATKKDGSNMDRDAFLKLLVTQLRQQDPMNPMQDKEFIAQLASFSSLEQMQQMNKGFDNLSKSYASSQAFGLTGKWVDYMDPFDPTRTFTGMVESVSYEDGNPLLKIGKREITMGNITRVYPDVASVGDTRAPEQAVSLIDKEIDYVDKTTGSLLSGKVKSVVMENGTPKLDLGSTTIAITDVIRLHQAESGIADSQVITIAETMVNRRIDYKDLNGESHTGVVKEVQIVKDWPSLLVGNDLVNINRVTRVY